MISSTYPHSQSSGVRHQPDRQESRTRTCRPESQRLPRMGPRGPPAQQAPSKEHCRTQRLQHQTLYAGSTLRSRSLQTAWCITSCTTNLPTHCAPRLYTPRTRLPWRTNVEQYITSPVITTCHTRTSGSPSGPSGSGSKNT